MQKYRVCLIGIGKMGKIFLKEIKKNNNYKIIKIINKREIKKNSKIIESTIKSKKINLVIIASPINTHFKYLEIAYKFNKNIIVEKPIVENQNQLNKLIKINKNFKKKIMIHHNDVINFQKFNYLTNMSEIKKVDMVYGKIERNNAYRKPFFDWLPHPLSFITNFFGNPKIMKLINYQKKYKYNLIIEFLKIKFFFNKFKIYLKFSNNLKKPSKKIIIFYKNSMYSYNGYDKKNYKTVKILLNKFLIEKKINDVSNNIKVYKLLFKIDKQIKNFKI